MIVLDYKDRHPLYEQITERFQELMLKGVLPEEAQLPSVRSLATELAINPNTIQRAYGELSVRDIFIRLRGKEALCQIMAVSAKNRRQSGKKNLMQL